MNTFKVGMVILGEIHLKQSFSSHISYFSSVLDQLLRVFHILVSANFSLE